jgi:transposase
MGRLITACGVKPIGKHQWIFKAFWVYGAIEPATGESFFLHFSHVDTDCFQKFLEELSAANKDYLNIVQADNGRFHKAKRLKIPENVVLIFQPPYCPELNPIERLWEQIKAKLKWSNYRTLEELEYAVIEELEKLTPEEIRSITSFPFIENALSVAQLI